MYACIHTYTYAEGFSLLFQARNATSGCTVSLHLSLFLPSSERSNLEGICGISNLAQYFPDLKIRLHISPSMG